MFFCCLQAQAIASTERTLLFRGPRPVAPDRPNYAPTLLSQAAWCGATALDDALPAFKGLARSFTLDMQAWARQLQSSAPLGELFPASWQVEVSYLFQMCPQCSKTTAVHEQSLDKCSVLRAPQKLWARDLLVLSIVSKR